MFACMHYAFINTYNLILNGEICYDLCNVLWCILVCMNYSNFQSESNNIFYIIILILCVSHLNFSIIQMNNLDGLNEREWTVFVLPSVVIDIVCVL